MFGNASIVTARSPHAVAVPHEAIQKGPTGPYVIVVGADKIAHFTPVVTGLADANFTSITSGLAAGENVVVLTSAPVKDGAKVETGGAAGGAPGATAAGGPGGQAQTGPSSEQQSAPAGQAPAAPPAGQPQTPAGAGSKSGY
jgi:multidrug efflux system membrane fusion protein